MKNFRRVMKAKRKRRIAFQGKKSSQDYWGRQEAKFRGTSSKV